MNTQGLLTILLICFATSNTSSILGPHSSILGPHRSILGPHRSILDPHSSILNPHEGIQIKRSLKSNPQNPSCVMFAPQDNLPAETVQLITYGAPGMSAYLAMGLAGDQMTFPSPGQQVTVHYALYLDDCTLIDSSRDGHWDADDRPPFTFTIGEGTMIEGFERGVVQMSLGQRVSMTLSPDMAYGEAGFGPGLIP